MGYDSKKLSCVWQAVAGPSKWLYVDTGGETAAAYQANGYFTDAKQYGVDTGDIIDVLNLSSKTHYTGSFTVLQDTGATTGTVVLDTGASK
jgi:hypothetical protein